MADGQLQGKRVLVVGAGTRPSDDEDPPMGNGRAIAVTVARHGAAVVCADRDEAAAAETVRLIEALGGSARVLVADVASAEGCAALVDGAGPGLDGLVLNVGIAFGAGLSGTTADDWDRTFAVNLRAHFLIVSALAPALEDGSSIVFVGSVAGLGPGSRLPAYDASKAGLIGLCRHVALELAPRGIRANLIAPGLIDTPLGRVASAGRPSRTRTPVPLGRQGTAWEVADPVAFLLSHGASYITGQVLAVDGGLTLIWPAPPVAFDGGAGCASIGAMDTRTLTVGDQCLVVAESGTGGRPLLLLHGFTGAKEDFTEWLDPLAARGWHAVAPDHRGHGSSSHPDSDDAYSFAILADDNLALADALSWDRFALLGHSMGGMVAQLMATTAPDRLTALVLMDTGHGPVEGLDPDLAAAAVHIVRTQGMDGLLEAMKAVESPLSTPAHLRLLAERPGYQEFGDAKMRATAPHLYAAMTALFVDSPDRLESLTTLPATLPTLVMVGDQDTPFLGPSQRMTDAIASATLAVIADAGHSPQFENPTGWWEALTGFLDSVA